MPLQSILQQIDDLQLKIDSFGKLDGNILNKINYKFRLDWNYHSNAMEGNSLTKEETRSVMINNVTVDGKPIKDVLEIKGHDKVIADILKIGKGELRLSEKRIKDIHKAIIYDDKPEQQKKIGQWKTENNFLTNYKDERFDFVAYTEVPEEMHNLINWLNDQTNLISAKDPKALHPAIIAFSFHLKYVSIHPFYDGNGRTARILTNLILISFGYPPIIIKLSEKNAYNQYLADIQGYGGSPDLYLEFMCKLLIHSQALVLKAIEGKDIEEADDINKEIELLKRQLANKDFSKSPKSIYNAFSYVAKEIWPKIQDSTENFSVFFKETKIDRFVNYLDEDFGTRKVSTFPSQMIHHEESLKPTDPKIFGHNIYDTDIFRIEWKESKLGLKGAIKKDSIEINLLLEFSKNEYTLTLSLSNNKLFTQTLNYSEYIDPEKVNELKTILGKSLLKTIKEYTEE